MIDYLHENYSTLLQFDASRLTPQVLEGFAHAIHDKGAPLTNCIGFIDGTVRAIARPEFAQRIAYNGHKRKHALKYQSVTSPDGLIIDFFGPVEGRRHDCFLLSVSGLEDRLCTYARDSRDQQMCVYGDPAYGVSTWILSPFGGNPTADQKEFNRKMSAVRETVEWGFQRIVNLFAFVDFKKNQKLGVQQVGKMYTVAALLSNMHACFVPSQTSLYFGVAPPMPEEYLRSANGET